jgi:hypothetical protein
VKERRQPRLPGNRQQQRRQQQYRQHPHDGAPQSPQMAAAEGRIIVEFED